MTTTLAKRLIKCAAVMQEWIDQESGYPPYSKAAATLTYPQIQGLLSEAANELERGKSPDNGEAARLRAALQEITDLCKREPANPFLADDMDRLAIAALSSG